MKTRCYNPNSISYKNYGARGITVDPEWRNNFQRFVDDMGDRPEGHTLDRINNNGNYCASNCKWSTYQEQSRTKRNRNKCIGVYYDNHACRWRAAGAIDKHRTHLGSFHEWWDAVCARKSWEHRVGLF